MRLCYFYRDEKTRTADLSRRQPSQGAFGFIRGDRVHPIDVPAGCWEAPHLWANGAFERLAQVEPERDSLALADVFLGPPAGRPAQFMDFYAFEEHVRTARARRGLDVVPEWYEVPAYYNSNATSLYGHGQTVLLPSAEDKLDYELELACVIGKTVRDATIDTAREAIAGYTILNDLSSRSRQRRAMAVGLGPCPGKDFGSVVGPCLVTKDELSDLRGLGMRAYVNGERWSEGTFGSIHYAFEEMIVYASVCRTLYPGDIIGSGTVGTGCGLELGRFPEDGSTIRLEVDGIGSLECTIQRAKERSA